MRVERSESQEFLDVFDGVGDGGGIGRTVGEKHAVRIERKYVLGRCFRGHHRDTGEFG